MKQEFEDFKTIMEAKKTAKAKVMEALGKAKLADKQGGDSGFFWDIVVEQGVNGVEGQKHKEAIQFADNYVAANPTEFALYDTMELEELVKVMDSFRAAGAEEQIWRLELYLLHKYEPQHIGGKSKAVVRRPQG